MEKLSNVVVEFYEKLSSWEHSVVKDTGLTLPQMHTIEVLGSSEPMRMKELAEKMGITTGTLTVNIDKLVKLGYVVRKPNEADKRSCYVALSDEGEEIYSRHHALHLELTEEILSELTPEEGQLLEKLLTKAMRAF
jgi:DNA-binding MarR family transcriptional regulator